MREIILAVGLMCFGFGTLAQDDFCEKSKNKKIKKIYEKLFDRETTDKERFALLQYDLAKSYFKKTIELCPTYAADAYYNLAMINIYEENREEAILYIDQYLAFKSDNDRSYGNQFEDKKAQLSSWRPGLQFWIDWHKNIVDFDPEKVKNISTTVDEYLPMLSPDNELMYFTRKEKRSRVNIGVTQTSNDFIEPLYMSYRSDVLKDFDGGKKLPPPFQTENFVGLGGVTISVDNHEMIVCGCENVQIDLNGDGKKTEGEVYKNCDLFSTTYEKVYNMNNSTYELKWSELKRLDDRINTPTGWEATPTLSGDGKTLYFAAVRRGDKSIDIHYSKRQEDGSWSRARKVKGINTNGDDKSPFMHADSKTMYFVSGPSKQGQMYADQTQTEYYYDWEDKSAGGFDIYYSKQDDAGKWSEPILMAKPINTQWDELGLIVSTDGHWAYFATNRLKNSGGSDVYRFELYEDAKPEKVTLLKGEVKKKDGTPDVDATIEVVKRGSEEKVTAQVNDDGQYALIVNTETAEDLIVTTKKDGHMPSTQLISKETIVKNQAQKKANIKVEDLIPATIAKGSKFTVKDILYNTASADLSSQAMFVLDQFINYLKENPRVKIEIQGHTDNEGISAKNKLLSQKRADGVKAYMVSKGITSGRLTARGFGQEQPKVANTSEINKAKNRRTDFKITAL